MDYNAALDYILSFADYERYPGFAYASRFDLRRMEELLNRLGNPHLGPRAIHIAGSKGKGSTAAMIAAALQASGYKVGLYTSPHLHTLRERISVSGQPISEQELAALVSKLKLAVEAVNNNGAYGELTTFEILTALGFLYFQQRGVDFQVLEAGLGGRLDATNVVQPEVCVITSISLDHTAVLGNSIEQIAREKAGIIKSDIVVVSSPQRIEAASVLKEVCSEREAKLIMAGEGFTWHKTNANLSHQSFALKGRNGWHNLTIPLLGDHQLENAATAVAALEVLNIPEQGISSGLAQVYWPGRLEILTHEPMLVIDGAHNADSARRLGVALKQLFDFDQSILIVGTSCDKDIAGIVDEVAGLFNIVIVTCSQHPRATPLAVLSQEFLKHGITPLVTEDVGQAMCLALNRAGAKSLICATGSLFLAAEVREWAKGICGERYPLRK